MFYSGTLTKLKNIFFPIHCLSCNKQKNQKWLCDECFLKLNFSPKFICPICKKETKTGKFCKAHKANHSLNGLWFADKYSNKTIKKLIIVMKYHFVKDISFILGKYLVFVFKNILKRKNKIKILNNLNNILIIPVPLHKRRLRWREFNQAKELAKIFSQNFNLKLNTDLKRIKYTAPQAKQSPQKRQNNIKNAFIWQGKNLKKKNIILIDDVATSLNTLEECSKILKQNGANEVWAYVASLSP